MSMRAMGLFVFCVVAMGCGEDFHPVAADAGVAVPPDEGVVMVDVGTATDTGLPPTCRTACGNLDCGQDPGPNCNRQFCGNLGGGCPTGLTCMAGHCRCAPNCTGRTCGPDGCGGACGTCDRGFQCGGSGACEVNPTSSWVITVTSGTVAERNGAGATWDSLGGAPDPFVCITMNGRLNCTPEATDTFAPSWNFALPAVTASTLLAGVATQFKDRDVAGADAICEDITLAFVRDTFVSGGGSRACASGRWSFTMRAQ